MKAPISAVYFGEVTHRRLRPIRHALRYRVFYLLLDLDEIDAASDAFWTFSHNKFNLLSFHDRDHGDGSGSDLRVQVRRLLGDAGLDADGPVRLLAMPRILGYVFNPLSVYFCHRADGSLAATVYEVTNTFKQRHSYLIPVEPGAKTKIRQEAAKSLYVSPFLGMDMDYSFFVDPPAERLRVCVTGRDAGGPLIFTKLAAERRPLTESVLLRAFLSVPFLTWKVVAGIHWEAFRLWLKGAPLRRRPPAPESAVTFGAPRPAGATTRERHVPRQ